jgi:hypothetical protein
VDALTFYFPEYFLAEWFERERNEKVTIWCFQKEGAEPLIQNYKILVQHLEIDCIILIDGGVDSLMHGDEPLPGTLIEDSLSLLAVSELPDVPVQIVACVGLGIEPEVGFNHLFENMAQLIRSQAFHGSCSLVQTMPAYKRYYEAVMYAFEKQPVNPSVICSSIVAATSGEYGDFHLTERTHGSRLNISPLMPIYWFFDAHAVFKNNLLIPRLRGTETLMDTWRAMMALLYAVERRRPAPAPLP